jgi:hypothetical protein
VREIIFIKRCWRKSCKRKVIDRLFIYWRKKYFREIIMIIVSKLLTMKKKVEKYYNEKKLKKNVG